MFQAPAGQPSAPPFPSSAAKAPGAPGTEPGEFTRLFASPASALPKQPLPFASTQAAPGLTPSPFGAPGAGTPLPATPPLGRPGIPERPFQSPPPQANVKDDYQRLFGGAQGNAAPAAPAHQGPAFGGATQSFQAPQMPVQGAPPAAGPSEFTRMFAAPQEMAAQQAPAQPAAPAAAPKPAAKWPIFLFAGVILIILIAVVILLLRG